MRVRCRATPEPRSDALGTLELASTPAGLWLVYQSVRRYREGYVPGPAAEPAEHRVPWDAVRVTRVGTEHLRLEVREPLSPFTHFYLREFTQAEPTSWLARARPWVRLSSPQAVLTDFCHELAAHLGAPVPSEVAAPADAAGTAASTGRSLSRTWAAFVILVSSAGLAALLWRGAAQPSVTESVQEQAAPNAAEATHTAAHPDSTSAVSPSAAEVAEPRGPTLGGGCDCVRHESVVWQKPPPRLTALVTRQQWRPHGTHQHLEIELQVVNNGDRQVDNLTFGVRFQIAKPGPPGSDDAPVERSLYLPSPLGPGQRVRWTVEGRGDRYELRIPALGRLDEDGLDAAPAEAFHALAEGNDGLVSLHAGMMLAFLGDARARSALLRLRAGLSQEQAAYVDRLLDGAGDLRVCQLRVSSEGHSLRLQSCLYNAAERPHRNFELKLRALQPTLAPEDPSTPAPQVLAEESLFWSGTLAPRRGRRLALPIELPEATAANRWLELSATHQESSE